MKFLLREIYTLFSQEKTQKNIRKKIMEVTGKEPFIKEMLTL